MSKRCLGCMELFGDEFEICPHCGYVVGTHVEEAIHIEPGTLLHDRYIIGKVLGYGGFGVTYLGWDGKLEQKVAIKEYLPGEFSTRMPGQSQVTTFSGDKSDSGMTGMALQALAPYCGTNAKVTAAVDKAVAALSAMQREDGSFYTYNTDGTTYSSSESTAQVIVALTALGINPETDPRFVKNGISAVDALCAYAVEGGGFRHLAGGEWNGMATEQGYYAMTAYTRSLSGKTSLYDMSDVTLRSSDPGSTDQPGDTDQPGNTNQPGSTDQPGNTNQPGSTEQTGNTQKPGGTTASGSVSQNGTAAPQTGDDSHITVWTGLMLVSMLAAVLLVRSRKRKSADGQDA